MSNLRGEQRSSRNVWRFADCEFDESRRELRVRGKLVDIEAKPLEVLYQLLLHAGEIVTKEELLESVWPKVMVVDGSLATAVSKLRKGLCDDSLVVTVPRIGYRLAAAVQTAPMPEPPSLELHLLAGEPVPGRDQWRLVRRLDVSLSSEVWLAEHPKTHEARVFKFAPDTSRLKGLKREVTLARLLRESLGERPDFVRVLEWNFEHPPYFVESEYAGPNLVEWAAEQGGLRNISPKQRLDIFLSVTRAIAAAHALDVLHKDLKPANILVSHRNANGTPQIKVADFGSAALLAPSRLGILGITNLGFTQPETKEADSLAGTVMYIAPEILAGQSPSTASDVYALGVLLYQLVAGDFRKPFAPGWEVEISDPLTREDIADAASGDPARRIKTATELAERLQNLESRRRERDDLARKQRQQLKRRKRVRLALAFSAVIAVMTATGAFIFKSNRQPKTSNVKAIAVLPFQNAGSDTTSDHLRLALPDEIATTLSHISGLSVRPFTTASRYTQHDLDVNAAGKELGAAYIVTGRFIKESQNLHISLETTDVTTGSVIWRDKMNAPSPSMIALQVQIALRVKGGLAPALGATTSDVGSQPKNEEAYDLFLRSIAVPLEPVRNADAIRMLERAVDLDPNYAPAWFSLARRYYAEAHYSAGGRGSLDRYDAAVKRALDVDPNYIAAGAGLVLSQVERGELLAAYKAATDLVSRRPDSADTHFALSYVLRFAGLLPEAATECDKAFLIDPQTQTTGLRSCAIVFMLLGDSPRALNYINLDPDSELAKAMSLDLLVRQGKEQEALQLASSYVPEWGGFEILIARLRNTPSSEISALAEKLRVSADPETNYFAAAHLAYAGLTEAASRMLAEAIKGNYCSYPAIDSDPMFAKLRSEPQYPETRAAAIKCQQNFLNARSTLHPSLPPGNSQQNQVSAHPRRFLSMGGCDGKS